VDRIWGGWRDLKSSHNNGWDFEGAAAEFLFRCVESDLQKKKQDIEDRLVQDVLLIHYR
jgi:hypothetical protein